MTRLRARLPFPRQIPGLIQWIDLSDRRTLVLVSSPPPLLVVDLAESLSYAQTESMGAGGGSGSGPRWVENIPGVHLPMGQGITNDWMITPFGSVFDNTQGSMFLVMRLPDLENLSTIAYGTWDGTGASLVSVGIATLNNPLRNRVGSGMGGPLASFIGTTDLSTETLFIVSNMWTENAAHTLRLNGAQENTETLGSGLLSGRMTFFAISQNGTSPGPYYQGQIGELLHYNRALPLADQQRVERYLAQKWGVPLS